MNCLLSPLAVAQQVTFILVPRGCLQQVTIHQQGADGLRGSVTVGLLDSVIHIEVADQVGGAGMSGSSLRP